MVVATELILTLVMVGISIFLINPSYTESKIQIRLRRRG